MRGAWIEILIEIGGLIKLESRSPCGERGLKSVYRYTFHLPQEVAPHAGSVD